MEAKLDTEDHSPIVATSSVFQFVRAYLAAYYCVVYFCSMCRIHTLPDSTCIGSFFLSALVVIPNTDSLGCHSARATPLSVQST